MASTWKYLIRFTTSDGGTYLATLDAPLDVSRIPGLPVIGHKSLVDLEDGKAGEPVQVNKLLAPLPTDDAQIICIGVNYRKHAEEAGLTVPLDPVMWYKPKRSLAGPGPVNVPKVASSAFLDFEGELIIVTSKDARDISIEEAPSYILGYTIGNDLTARAFQDPKRCGGQYTRAKNFDGFAPIGPVLTRAEAFGRSEDNRITTTVNGRVFQDSNIDLIHSPAKLLSFLSQGVTIPAGTAIMTGSPPGIGYFQVPKYSLNDGDVVEISIASIGTLSNTMVFS